ncbi:exonuclease domain-containing protein [Planktotalea sp.]|uniref:exonuclease domain-containing protein n=1 Tax=Planktotalea sp. TaxID=2029877 RepID=UPI003D6AB0D6
MKDVGEILERDFRFVALDVETANGDSSSICQIGIACIPETGPSVTICEYIDPQAPFSAFNVQLHGIDAARVQGAPIFPTFFEAVLPLLARHTIVQHSSFDKRAIGAACAAYGLAEPDLNWIDSVKIARRAWPEFRGNGGHGLGNLKVELGLNFNHHDAGEDALAAAEVVLLAEERTGLSFQELSLPSPKNYPKSETRTGDENGAFFGQSVVFTGQLETPRPHIADNAAAHGFAVKSSVSRKTDVVVVGGYDLVLPLGRKKSAKHRKAEELAETGHDIQILEEHSFLVMLKEST